MAKEYAYYIEGNKVGIVEKDTAFSNNISSKEYGPGVSRAMWKSPQSSVTDGLEIKYAHSLIYRKTGAGAGSGVNDRVMAWGSNGDNLTLFNFGSVSYDTWAGKSVGDTILISGILHLMMKLML